MICDANCKLFEWLAHYTNHSNITYIIHDHIVHVFHVNHFLSERCLYSMITQEAFRRKSLIDQAHIEEYLRLLQLHKMKETERAKHMNEVKEVP